MWLFFSPIFLYSHTHNSFDFNSFRFHFPYDFVGRHAVSEIQVFLLSINQFGCIYSIFANECMFAMHMEGDTMTLASTSASASTSTLAILLWIQRLYNEKQLEKSTKTKGKYERKNRKTEKDDEKGEKKTSYSKRKMKKKRRKTRHDSSDFIAWWRLVPLYSRHVYIQLYVHIYGYNGRYELISQNLLFRLWSTEQIIQT